MPRKGTKRVTDAQRRVMAAGRVAGKTVKALAQATGLAPKTVEKQLKDPRTVTYAQEYKARDEKALSEIWALMIKRLRRDIDAADPDIRRHARGQFMKLLVLGENTNGDQPGNRPPGDMTLEELLTAYRMDLVAVGVLKTKK